MRRIAYLQISMKTIGLLALFVFGEVLVGMAAVYLPSYWITLLLGLVVFLLVTSYPMLGVSLMLVSLYFPILPTVPLGPLEFSASTLPAVGLALGAFLRLRVRGANIYLANWQKVLVIVLGLAFLLSSLFSSDFLATARLLPNMGIYLLILLGIMAEVNTKNKLEYVAKLIIVLAFILSIWRVELRFLRVLVGLPSLGVNGAAFTFHPGVALALVVVLFAPREMFSRRWRWFAGITLLSLVIHGVQYETRAAWLSWLIILLALVSIVHWERWLRFLPIVLIMATIAILIYGSRIEFNYRETATTMQVVLNGGSYSTVSSDDRLRLLARDAGLRMFQARPAFGWGANRFDFLKPNFVGGDLSKEAVYPGTFNSWLLMLVEMGALGVLAGLIVSLTPLVGSWFLMRKKRTEINTLAFGFALGVLGLVVHLFFIDLMFSFYWIHVAIGLAALRLGLEENKPVIADAA